MEEQAVAIAALDALKAWTSGETNSPSIHPQVRLFLTNDTSNLPSAARLPPAEALSVVHVQILTVGLKNAAQAKVLVDEGCGFLVLLHTEGRWQCISGSILPNLTKQGRSIVTPKGTMDVTTMVWDGYCDANCSCQGDLMKGYFHKQCRLTYVDDGDVLRIMDCDSFCHMVTHRYSMELHKPYAHLKDSAGDKTSLISIDFATPDVAMVMLKVGHPPFLWTDLLTCMNIDSQWWIVHKSSCHEDFLQ